MQILYRKNPKWDSIFLEVRNMSLLKQRITESLKRKHGDNAIIDIIDVQIINKNGDFYEVVVLYATV